MCSAGVSMLKYGSFHDTIIKELEGEADDMKNRIICIAMVCLCAFLCSCGQAPAQPAGPSQDEQLYEKYKDIISDLEGQNYDLAIDKIKQMKKDAAPSDGNIEDYLLEVNLTGDNFYDYFEFEKIACRDMYGDETGSFMLGLRSKMFDKGYVLCNYYDRDYCDSIYFELKNESHVIKDASLIEMLSFSSIGFDSGYFYEGIGISGRVAGTKLTFVSKDFVESYEIAEIKDLAKVTTEAEITLKNGLKFGYLISPDYPY